MKKLLYVTTVPVTLRAFLLPYAAHFRGRGLRVDAAAEGVSRCGVCREAFDNVYDLPFSRNPLHPANLASACGKIRLLVEREGYDWVHVHTPVAAFVTRLALRKSRLAGGPKVIYTAHGFHFHSWGTWWRNVLFQALERVAGRWTDYLIVINTEDAGMARRQQIVPPERLIFMPGIGVDRELYAPERVSPAAVDRVRAELGLKEEDVLFLMIGEYISRKRQQDGLKALRALPSQAHLALAGDGLLKDTLTGLAASLGLRDRVHFLGQRQDIAALVRTSRAVVLSSAQEGLPRSVMESLCLETPVIGARIRGVRELVDDQCGILVPMGDVPALSKAMDHLFHNPATARDMGRRGRAKMSTCDLRYILQLHEELYEKAKG